MRSGLLFGEILSDQVASDFFQRILRERALLSRVASIIARWATPLSPIREELEQSIPTFNGLGAPRLGAGRKKKAGVECPPGRFQTACACVSARPTFRLPSSVVISSSSSHVVSSSSYHRVVLLVRLFDSDSCSSTNCALTASRRLDLRQLGLREFDAGAPLPAPRLPAA
jgi:hypothetical protein